MERAGRPVCFRNQPLERLIESIENGLLLTQSGLSNRYKKLPSIVAAACRRVPELLNYRTEEFPIALARIARAFDRPALELIDAYRTEGDLLAGIDVGLMAILLQVRAEDDEILKPDVLELAEICSARLRNLVFGNDNWESKQEWESVSRYFAKLHDSLREYIS